MKQQDRKDLEALEAPTISVPVNAGLALSSKVTGEVVEKLFDPDRVSGYSTGFSSLDAIVGGLRIGSLTIVGAGASGMGKSIFGINLIVNLNKAFELPVVYIDLENGVLESLERIIKIWNGDMLPEDFFRVGGNYKSDVLKMRDEFNTFSYYSHEDITESSRGKIVKLVNFHAKKGYKIFLIDPLEIIPAEDCGDPMREEALVIKNLKDLAQEKGLIIIILHHVRKTQNGGDTYIKSISEVEIPKMRIPVMDDFKGLGKTVNLATGVWVIVRMQTAKSKKERNKTLLRVLKNRFGDLGDVYLEYQPATLRFIEVTKEMEKKEAMDNITSPLFADENLKESIDTQS